MAAPNDKYTADQMIEAAHKTMGIVTAMANKLDCTPQTVRNYAKRYVTVARAIEEARESIVDLAEVKLVEKVRGGDVTSILFTLKTLGKQRGYVERQEVTGKDGEALTVKVLRGVSMDDL